MVTACSENLISTDSWKTPHDRLVSNGRVSNAPESYRPGVMLFTLEYHLFSRLRQCESSSGSQVGEARRDKEVSSQDSRGLCDGPARDRSWGRLVAPATEPRPVVTHRKILLPHLPCNSRG
jgi:hypothetical protein